MTSDHRSLSDAEAELVAEFVGKILRGEVVDVDSLSLMVLRWPNKFQKAKNHEVRRLHRDATDGDKIARELLRELPHRLIAENLEMPDAMREVSVDFAKGTFEQSPVSRAKADEYIRTACAVGLLENFLSKNDAVDAVAEELDVDRTTVFRRIKRASELWGVKQ